MAAVEKSLVSFDTDRIKDYVFSSAKLAEIRGASAILDRLNRTETKAIFDKHGARAIYIGGGSALAIVDRSCADQMIREVEEAYWNKTRTGSITGVQVPLPPGYNGENFDQYFRLASTKLRSKKMKRGQQKNLVTLPHLAICESCGRYPAEVRGQDDLLCISCLTKRNQGRIEHRGRVGLMREFGDKVTDLQEWQDAEMAADFVEIGSVSHGCPGYIGLIYCDGNRMGDMISQQKTTDDYGRFSKLVDGTLRDKTVEVLRTLLPPRTLPGESKSIFPFEIIMLGGDDLILVTAADMALEVAVALASGFEQETQKKNKDRDKDRNSRLSLSVGVTIAHATYPFYAILDTAEELLKSAKMRSFGLTSARNPGMHGAIDFMVITNTTGLSIKQLRKEEFSYQDGESLVTLTERPYSIEETSKLISIIKKLKEVSFPQNKLEELYESLFKSKAAAMYQSLVTMGRLDPKHQKVLRAFFDEHGINSLPWRQHQQGFSTPLGDLIELYAFIGNEVRE